MIAALVAGVFINRSMTNWHSKGLRQIKRQDALINVLLRKKRRELEKVTKTLNDLRETEGTFARLVATNEYAKHSDPGEWLLQNKHISLSLYLKAKKLAQRRDIEVVDACVELGAIDTKMAREAVNATCGSAGASRSKSGHLARAQQIEQNGKQEPGCPPGETPPAQPKGPGPASLNGRSTS